ncbi:hypothetical protein EPUS_05609 [Endocarpon pusillum Z07020]|uniref:Uncharacterized protein n=1 Tax=Endocarpon pusillum (strain Z07020 / HMAS-L-300199) TaxID=1263415 RepID=U1G377_ENDPU|nr:uncharacterized protein EPUS_05609 [Endocarpon pusillum Z07020]ERF71737.1 hypothetical protein EPUS_05609 [Endocarpon pusillum Z07020]
MCLFNVPLIGRFGYSSIIGLIPAVGDALDSLLAYMLIRKCCSVEPGLPHKIKNAMLMNLAFDFFIGLVPLLGDIADAIYKCNTKNYLLLEKELTKRAVQRQEGAGISNPAAGSNFGQHYVESEERYGTNTPSGPPPKYTSTKKPRRPEPAYDPRESEGRGGYFGGRREVDLEAGGEPSRNQAFRSQRNA